MMNILGKTLPAFAVIALLWALPVTAGLQPERLSGALLITGSSTMAPMVAEIARRFQARHPDVHIEVQAGGSGRGIADAQQGKADIGMASRLLTEAEPGLLAFPMARDGVVAIVHRDNPVRSLTSAQLTAIYTGKIGNWKQVGGRDAAIFVLASQAERGSSQLLFNYLHLKYDQVRPQQIVGDNAERIKAMAGNPHAIAYISVGEAERKAWAGAPIKLLPLDGIAATSKSIRDGDYPISRPLTLITKELPVGLARAFIEFCLSSQVTDLILAYDFVPYQD